MPLNRDFSKSINHKIISKLSEKFATNSKIIGVNFIKIRPEMTSGYLFEKIWFYMKYIVNFLSGNRYMAHSLVIVCHIFPSGIPCSCCTKSYLQNALFMAFNLSGLLSSTCATSSLGEVTFSVSKLYD